MIHDSQQSALIHLADYLSRKLSTEELQVAFTARD